MSTKENDIWLEHARQNLEEALDNGDWPTTKVIIADMEEKGFDASGARRLMNLAMNDEDIDEDEITIEPYEHPTPPTIKPEEDDAPQSNHFESKIITEVDGNGELYHTLRDTQDV